MNDVTTKRLTELDLAKGIAISLVVLGHVVAGEYPAENEWYATLKRLIYKFHMPLFMFLSGAVAHYTYRPLTTVSAYRAYVTKRAGRLLPGFLVFSLLIWGAKEAAGHVLHVDNASSSGADALLNILVQPGASVARSLWYIYVLAEYCTFFPLLLTIARGNLRVVVGVCALIHGTTHVVDVTTMFALDQFCEYTLYFALGMLFIENYARWSEWIASHVVASVTLFLLSFLSMQLVGADASKTIIGLSSLAAVYGIAASLRGENDRHVLGVLSKYTYTIYLMNTLFIGLSKGLLLKLMPWDGRRFLIFFPILLVMGILGPIAAHKLFLSKFRRLDRMTK